MQGIRCPLCQQALERQSESKTLRCAQGHSFDLARQGYANLLLSHKKNSKAPGDSGEMVQARRQFLEAGYYQAFAERIIAELDALVLAEPATAPLHYLDIGCGEGYYTAKIADNLRSKYSHIVASGLDISTPAVKAACQRDRDMQWLVASAKELPVDDNSCDVLSVMFCRVELEEAYRALKPGGCLLVASTAEQHLIEMRQHLYEEVKDSKPYALPESNPGFKRVKQVRFAEQITLDNAPHLQQLLMMTPHYWRTRSEQQQALAAQLPLALTLDLDILILQKQVSS